MKYVLYEGKNGDMLFTREDKVKENMPKILEPFENKNPTWTCEANSDNDAITLLNAHMMARSVNK